MTSLIRIASHTAPTFQVTPTPVPEPALFKFVEDAGDFFKDIDYDTWQGNVILVFVVLTVLFLALAVFSYLQAHKIIKSHHHAKGHAHHPEAGHDHPVEQHAQTHQENPYTDSWEQIKRYANSVRESEWKLSVIEADKLVDDALKAKGFAGETMGERLMMISPAQLKSLQDLWDAHKLRNLIVHDANFKARQEQISSAVNGYERVLRELGAIV